MNEYDIYDHCKETQMRTKQQHIEGLAKMKTEYVFQRELSSTAQTKYRCRASIPSVRPIDEAAKPENQDLDDRHFSSYG